MNDNKCVHTEHCCILHGCKYCDDDCPVEKGIKPQSYLCESCDPFWENTEKQNEKIWAKIKKKFQQKIDNE
jgi:hypothetical protein